MKSFSKNLSSVQPQLFCRTLEPGMKEFGFGVGHDFGRNFGGRRRRLGSRSRFFPATSTARTDGHTRRPLLTTHR